MPKEPIVNTDAIKASVCAWLQWTEEQHTSFLFESGMRYLETFYHNDEVVVSYLQSRALFWNWWKNLWSKRDHGILGALEQLDSNEIALHLRREYYAKIHDVKMLCCEIVPNRVVLGNQFAYLKQLV